MSLTIGLETIKCIREINEPSASEEPYVLVTSVQLQQFAPGTSSVHNVSVFRYGVWENFDAGEVKVNNGPPFWGLSSTPEEITDLSSVSFIISLIENDNASPSQYQSLIEAVAALQLGLSLGETRRTVRFSRLLTGIRNALNGVGELPIPIFLDDDHIGTEELKLDNSDLLPDGGVRDKTMTIRSSEGHYELTFRIRRGFTDWQALDGNAASKAIVADGNNLYRLHNNGYIVKYAGSQPWQRLDTNSATKKIVAAGGNLYQLHNNGHIWKYVGNPSSPWQKIDENGATIDIVAGGGNLYQLHNSGHIWRYVGNPSAPWQKLDGNAATRKIEAAGNNLYQIHQNGFVWKYTGHPSAPWLQLDNNAASVDIVADGNHLYQRHRNGFVWKYTGHPSAPWLQLDDNTSTKKIVAGGGHLYQLHTNGSIWKYKGNSSATWLQLDDNADSVDIVASGNNFYQIHKNGFIWKYTK